MEKIWLKHYPAGVPAEVSADQYNSITDVLAEAVKKYGPNVAYVNMGAKMTYNELDQKSTAFAAYLQNSTDLKPGDRIAIQSPNVLQYPVVVFGALKAGLIIVNTNPLYTEREMIHQFNDSGAKALVILANFAHMLKEVLPKTQVKYVFITEIGDLMPFPKGAIVNFVVKSVKKMVPPYSVPGALSLKKALKTGAGQKFTKPAVKPSDIAFLQYTGGTTGVSKGAMLTHHNILINLEQMLALMKPFAEYGKETIVTALPLYHIFALTVNCLAFLKVGGTNVLITNPRDINAFVKELKKTKFTVLTGVNTLFNALLNHPEFAKLDFSNLKVSVGGAMALQLAVVERWKKVTGTTLVEGYGLTEASPLVSANPFDGTERIGTIGIPAPSTDVKLVDDDGHEITDFDTPGELCVKGPQVMKGYWQRPDETDKVIDKDGWLHTGDMAIWLESGFLKIVDRKKDMILVSGFNVYPNEIEDVVAMHPGVLEVAAIGVPSEKSGEAVKIFVVKKDPNLTEKALLDFCREQLTGYKMPKIVEFRAELPKTNVGKILRKNLREEAKSQPPVKV